MFNFLLIVLFFVALIIGGIGVNVYLYSRKAFPYKEQLTAGQEEANLQDVLFR